MAGSELRIGSERRMAVLRWIAVACLTIVIATGRLSALLAEGTAESGQTAGRPVPRQVLIEVLVFEIETDKAGEIGFDWLYGRGSRGREHGSVVQETALRTLRFNKNNLVTFPTPDTGPSAGATIRPDLDPAVGGVQSLAGLTGAGDVIIGDRATIYGRMRALVDRGAAEITSRPAIVVQDGKKAEIHVGGEIPYQNLIFDNKGNPRLDVAFEKIGVDLVVTPQILPGDVVRLTLEPVKVAQLTSTENIRGVDLPYFGQREARTTVRVPSTEMLVIGGLRSRETRENVRRIPGLGRIPILGFFFRTTETSTVETELKILITPTILERGQEVVLPPDFTRAEDARKRLEEELF